MCLAISRGFLIQVTTPGLDPSFIYAYNYAAAHGLAWGRAFIATYGPYGYLLKTMDVGDLIFSKIVWTLLLEASIGFAAVGYLWSAPHLRTGERVALLVGLVYSCAVLSSEYQWFGLILLLLLIGVHHAGGAGILTYAIAGLLTGFCLLMKLSLGGGTILTLGVACVLTRSPRLMVRRAAMSCGSVVVGFYVGWVFHGGPVQDIWPYLATGWEVSRGYSSAMALALPNSWIGAISFLVWLLVLVAWAWVRRGPRTLLSLGVLAVPLFVAWKHSIVRQDEHVQILTEFGVFVMMAVLSETTAVRRWRWGLPSFVLLFVLLAFPGYGLPPKWLGTTTSAAETPCGGGHLLERFLDPPRLCGARDLLALQDLSEFRRRLAEQSKVALRADVLPGSIRSVVGDSPVDVYPSEIAYVPANGLTWANRPLPASFTSYSPLLDDRNAAFFESDRRPRYLLWSTQGRIAPLLSIDERHVFWDEPKTLRTILDYYDLREAGENVSVLRARSRPRFASIQPLGSDQVEWNASIAVPQAPGVLLAHAAIDRSVTMRAIRTAFRENAVFLSLRFASGEEVRHRLVPDNAIQGIWLTPLPETRDELHDLLRTGSGRRVVAIRFSTGRLSRLYAPVRISWSQLTLANGKWTGEP